MANFLCLIFFVFFFSFGSVFAGQDSVPPIPDPNYQGTYCGYATLLACKSAQMADSCRLGTGTPYVTPGQQVMCTRNGVETLAGYYLGRASCPVPTYGGAYSLNPFTNMCERANACTAGVSHSGSVPQSAGPAVNVCASGCVATASNVSDQYRNSLTHVPVYVGVWVETGESCAPGSGGFSSTAPTEPINPVPNPPPDPNAPLPPPCATESGPASCPAGESRLVTNCVATCSGGPNAPPNPPPDPNAPPPNPPPDPNAPPPNTPPPPVGSNSDVVAAVDSLKKALTDNSLTQYCKDNPRSKTCLESIAVASDCTAFQCDGDAIQCAILKDQHDLHCRLSLEQNLKLEIGQRMIDGTDSSFSNPVDSANRVVVDFAGLDSSSPISAACPADINFSFQGRSIVLPLSGYCGTLTFLGNVFFALSLLAAAKIIGEV